MSEPREPYLAERDADLAAALARAEAAERSAAAAWEWEKAASESRERLLVERDAALARAEAAEARVRELEHNAVLTMRDLAASETERAMGLGRITALITAGDGLAEAIENANPGTNGHALGCNIDRRRTLAEIERHIHPACDCGNWDAVAAWERAKEGQP